MSKTKKKKTNTNYRKCAFCKKEVHYSDCMYATRDNATVCSKKCLDSYDYSKSSIVGKMYKLFDANVVSFCLIFGILSVIAILTLTQDQFIAYILPSILFGIVLAEILYLQINKYDILTSLPTNYRISAIGEASAAKERASLYFVLKLGLIFVSIYTIFLFISLTRLFSILLENLETVYCLIIAVVIIIVIIAFFLINIYIKEEQITSGDKK